LPAQLPKTCPCGCGRTVNRRCIYGSRECAQKMRVWTPEQRERQAALQRGRRYSPEQRANLSAVRRAQWADPVFREAVARGQKVAFQREEERKRKSEATRRMWADPQHRAKVFTDETRAKMSESGKRGWADPIEGARRRATNCHPDKLRKFLDGGHTPEVAQRVSAAQKRLWADPVHRERQASLMNAVFVDRERPSNLHRAVKVALSAAGVDTTTHFRVRWYSLDEAIPELKLAVEVHGCYWHGCPECRHRGTHRGLVRTLVRDRAKQTYLMKHGWTVVVIWEHEWKANPDACIQRVQDTRKILAG